MELPFAKVTSTEDEEAIKSSGRCAGVETPFDVADITEEAVDAGKLANRVLFRLACIDQWVTSDNVINLYSF